MTPAKHLTLIDGSGYIFRAYYAIRPLSTSKGFPTNAIYGFTQMLLKLQKEANPSHWAVIFDTKEPTFRDTLYAKYKANRKEPPDDLVPQFEYFPKVVKALNIPMLAQPGFEADDLIATLAKQASAQGFTVTIISGDKDLLQLVGGGIDMWDTMKEKRYTEKEAREKFGVRPDQITDLFGLMGDASDNIPGVPGIGPKTGTRLIQEYGSLEKLLENTQKLSGKMREAIEKYKEQARLSKQLAVLHENVPVKFEPEIFEYRPIDAQACHQLFRELEFSRLLSELAPKESLSKEKYRLILSKKELQDLCAKIEKEKPMLALDLETTSLDVLTAKVVGISLSWREGEACYIPAGHTGPEASKQMNLKEALEILKPVFKNRAIPKVGQNLKYDLPILKLLGVEVENILCDTMIASYLLNPAGPHNLDDLSQQHLDHRTIHYEEVTGKGAKQISFAEVPLDQALAYAAEDADCTRRLAEIFLPRLKKEGLQKLFEEIEMPLMRILMEMELAGMKVDADILKKMSKEFEGELKKVEGKIFEAAGESFNINSPKQLGEVLFEKLKLSGGKKTKTGFSTSQEVMESRAAEHPVCEMVLNYRSLSKLKSTYCDGLLKLVHPKTGRIHTSFNQTVAATGRLSSSEPNLQNIPIRAPEGKKIREAFIAEPGFTLLSADYSQIELRILAHFTQDENLLAAFREGLDVHEQTAAQLGIDRPAAKTVNFAVIYGQSAYGLAQQLKISFSEAALIIENYFKQYPKVKPFREKILGEAKEKGFVTTLFGRRRFVPDLLSRNPAVRNNAERMAFNTVFQGSAADIIKKAMIHIDRGLEKISPQSRMILQVHDELVFEVGQEELPKVKDFVRQKMEGAFQLRVPLVVECGVGENWAGAH